MGIACYERVMVRASPDFPDHVGRSGVVIGESRRGRTVLAYGVSFDGEDEILAFAPGDLEGTGEVLDRAEIYDDGLRLRVSHGGDVAD